MMDRDDGAHPVPDVASENYLRHGFIRVYADGSTYWTVHRDELDSVLAQWRGAGFEIVTRDADGTPLHIKRATVTGMVLCSPESIAQDDAYHIWRADRANAKNREASTWE